MFKNLRINIIKELLELNEELVFNRRLIKYYKNELSSKLKTVIDVGVNTGQSIKLFRKISKDCFITGFEPNPTLFQNLIKKYHSQPNIKLHQIGISNQKGLKTFYENVLHSTSSFEELNYESDYLSKKAKILGVNKKDIIRNRYEVEVTTLNDYINGNCNSDIDILKIDTEGHEYYCLEGLFAKQLNVMIKYIQIEEHNDDMYLNKRTFEEIQRLLEENAYEIAAKIRHGFGDFAEVVFKNKLS